MESTQMSINRQIDKEALVIYTKEYYSAIKKEYIWVSCNEMDEPRTYYTEWSKSDNEKQMSYINTYTWNLERWYWWNYLQVSNGDTDIENRLMDMVW